ncbi:MULTISPECIES: N-6 DNA methylase [Niastella]|uniref:N-6 DNA methylase n=1 Tax=Niastella soli TaxID=2821487 RepID=A0ABS3YQP5_9BACT|nr:N-6 DNA methylase [Niastella soli]MBO9200236.1 N-6 DNA methylase [Niastella soli]
MQVEIKGSKIFSPLNGKWLPCSEEEKLKQEFICRLINNYGYDISQLGQDVEIKKRYKADIAIWGTALEKKKNSIPSIIITVECKAEHIKIKESDYTIGYNFASTINANFFIAVNLKETKVFHIQKDNSPKKIEKLIDIPKAEVLLDEKRVERYIKDTKSFTKDEFTKLLTRCHNIIRNNDKLSPEAAFDEISKVLFMKIMFEKNSTEEMIFSKAKFQTDEKNYEKVIRPKLKKDVAILDQDYMQYLFDSTKQAFETEGIFDPKDQLKIKRASFELIVEELEAFNLSDTSDDVKGIAFEQFLGKTFRGELGQFFTPRTIVDYMVDILDPKEGELICDPCCGSGGFLITAFDYVRNKIDEDIKVKIKSIKEEYSNPKYDALSQKEQEKVEKNIRLKVDLLNEEFNLKNPKGRYYNLSHNCIYGTDANPRMARTAKMNMIMHGDGHGGVHHHDGLLNVNGIFENRFDIILTNPPFGARVEESLRITEQDRFTDAKKIKGYISRYGDKYETALKQIDSNVGKPILSLFETGKMSSLTEVLFLERCLNLLKPGGRLGIVLPEGVMNNNGLQKIREYVESRAKIINITSIPQDVFISSGATIKPSILFLEKYSDEVIERNRKLEKSGKDYRLVLTNITNAGINSNGTYSDGNEFPQASQEFKSFVLDKYLEPNFNLIKICLYSELINWSVAHNFDTSFQNYNTNYNSVHLNTFLKKNNDFVKVDDNTLYKRITIKINNNGIQLRDTVIGSKIGTKRQVVIKKGQFAISKIDARHGAMGIIPDDLDGAIVTPDFLTYTIDKSIILPEYLELIISTKSFIDFCKKFSSGTTNRQRLNETLFLNAKIPMPPIEQQILLVGEISELKKTIAESEKKLTIAKKEFEKKLF